MKAVTKTTRLGALLRFQRFLAGQGVREAAKEFGVSAATVSRIERGYQPDAATFLKLLQWLLGPAEVRDGKGARR